MTAATGGMFLTVLGFATACATTGGQTSATQPADPGTRYASGVVYHDLNGNGLRDAKEKGLPGVGVSNGRQVVRTDAEGRYRLPVTDDTIVFVIKPAGWMTPVEQHNLPHFYYLHKPAGSPPLEYPGVAPTGPLPDAIDFALYRHHEPQRFRVILLGDPQPRNQRDIDYLAHDVVEELVGTQAAFGISLGDLVYNDLSLFESLVQTVGLIGVPWYNLLGNHDQNYDSPDDQYADETFERVFGPAYYAFDYGSVHFLVLDDVIWTGAQGQKLGDYRAGLGAKQLEFIGQDLALVPPEKLVVLTMHIPLVEVEDRAELFRLLEGRPHTLSLSAHWHLQGHAFLSTEDGWNGPQPHHHLILATVCGSWWTGAPDEVGIPHTTMRDGTPNGYSFITFDGHRYQIEFKAARRSADYQMNIYAPEQISAAQAEQTEILVNVFAGSERSRVQMRLSPSGPWTPMRQVERPDPSYVQLREAQSKFADLPWRGLPKPPIKCPHMWQAYLAANPPTGTQMIHVRAIDMFDQTYTAHRVIRIVPDPISDR